MLNLSLRVAGYSVGGLFTLVAASLVYQVGGCYLQYKRERKSL